ncbi:MAG: prepilin-type N-terminal cleavage/methylation domain-containing protein [Candidatus Omnitrophica bacterium]|nr:prepilin-type N-terminal cleavage/methylation domain-containing protein [Candidatus Omnitrophota bacterium]
MILKIGNKSLPLPQLLSCRRGITFVEMMAALVIFSLGMTTIFLVF